MNLQVLKQAEKKFMKRYPGGFQHPEIVAIGKKHKMAPLIEQAQASFKKENFSDANFITSELIKVVSRSSMVSLFEKPKFRDWVLSLKKNEKATLTRAFKELLHGNESKGFEFVASELLKGKLAKWTLLTVLGAYYRPKKDLLIKPTTTKLIIDKLGLDLVYHPKPTWKFYHSYREQIQGMKKAVDPSLSPNNAAFCGFLMMSLGDCH